MSEPIDLDQLYPPKLGAGDNPGVHGSHCCPTHGCKYGYRDCPVKGGTLAPRYPGNNGCEQCEFDAEHDDDYDEELDYG